jgi:hypothetical protein
MNLIVCVTDICIVLVFNAYRVALGTKPAAPSLHCCHDFTALRIR